MHHDDNYGQFAFVKGRIIVHNKNDGKVGVEGIEALILQQKRWNRIL